MLNFLAEGLRTRVRGLVALLALVFYLMFASLLAKGAAEIGIGETGQAALVTVYVAATVGLLIRSFRQKSALERQARAQLESLDSDTLTGMLAAEPRLRPDIIRVLANRELKRRLGGMSEAELAQVEHDTHEMRAVVTEERQRRKH